MIISINQKIIDTKQASIPVDHRAFLNGLAVFETLRTYDRKIFRLADHLDRLFLSAKLIKLDSPWSADQIKQAVKRLQAVAKKKIELRFRIILADEDLIIMMMPLEEKPIEFYEEGVDLVSYKGLRSLPEAKILGCVTCFMANEYAKSKKVYDSILINPFIDQITECSYANLFWVKNKRLYTTNENILKGITREVVLELAGDCQFESLKTDQLKKADEVFITQTTSGILPVKSIDGQGFKVGSVTKNLMEQFNKLTWEN